MLTVLTIKDYSDKRRFFKMDKTQFEVVKYNNLHIVHIIYYKYGKGVRWDRIKTLAGNESTNILCNKDIVFPPESGLKRYNTNLLKERIAENSAIEVLKKNRNLSENLIAGLYDPKGEKTEIVQSLIRYTGKLIVVTNAIDEYYSVYKEIISTTGAVINIKRDVSDLSDCDIVIAPKKIDKEIPINENAVIFTATNPAICQRGIVYNKYIVSLKESYKEIKPPSLSDEYFAQALYDKGKQHKIGSVLPVLCIADGINSTIDEISRFLAERKIKNDILTIAKY